MPFFAQGEQTVDGTTVDLRALHPMRAMLTGINDSFTSINNIYRLVHVALQIE